MTHPLPKIPAEPRPEWIRVSVDDRERIPLNVSPLIPIVERRDTADYGLVDLPDVAALELKGSIEDLLGCVGRERERFERELARLRAFPVRGLIIAATWQDLERGDWRAKVSPAAVIGSLLAWGAFGIPIWLVGTRERAAEVVKRTLYLTARRHWRQIRGIVLHGLEQQPDGK